MDEKEKREKEELKKQLHDMSLSQKLEYFWMYYKWVVVIGVFAVLLIIAGVDWARNLQDKTALGIMAANSIAPPETAEEEIKEIIGLTDKHDKVEITGSIAFNPETGELDYYSQMAFLANLASRELDMVFVPEVGLENMRNAFESLTPEDLFEEEAERYKDCFEEGFFRLPEGNEASRLLDLPYEPVYVGVVDGSKNPENAALFLKVLLEE